MKSEGGFTFLELLVALGLLALGMLLFLQTSVLTLRLHARSRRGTEALLLAQEKMEILLAQGFRRVENLAGGIDRWSLQVDPAVTRY